jgi:hypothetical protein
MASEYRLLPPLPGAAPDAMQMVLRVADQAHIPFDGGNRDYQTYLAWLAEGNEPDPAPPPPE